VRQAELESEELTRRVRAAETDSIQRGCQQKVKLFRQSVADSVAVIAMDPGRALALLNDSTESYTTCYRLVAAGVRSPRANRFDQVRGIADELLFPNYREYISFAALSLDGQGCWYYGSVHFVLADFAICDRTTVFESNSLLFCDEHRLGTHKPLPNGYRAVWRRRDELAAAKLAFRISPATSGSEFAPILIRNPNDWDAEFIEVHMYGGFNRASIQKVVIRNGGDEIDIIKKGLIKRVCERTGIPVEAIQ
jgi:hypothetical protein